LSSLETGVGKELIPGAMPKLSGRQGEFLDVNVAGVDDHFFSDTLFGHKRGAFTGADRDRKGLIGRAAGGNQTFAAQMLGLTRRALNNRLKRSHP